MAQSPETGRSFAALLELEELGPDRFQCPLAPENSGRMFGGQFMAQALAAVQQTVEDHRAVHSLHGYFLRPGDVEQPTEIEVDRVRDGRSFSVRAATAVQGGKELFRMLTSLHVAEPGKPYAGAVMPAVPGPDDVQVTYNNFASWSLADNAAWDGANRPMDIRYVNAPTAARGVPVTADQLMWMRIDEPLAPEPSVHLAALAYLSDSTLVDHVLLPHGERWHDPRWDGASLDHAMWFHRAARADEWLLFSQHVETTGGGRGLATGRFFDVSGSLVATCAQEGLVRLVD